jgi:methylmalonyl-CoA mutase N-terminal domain/subunit
MKEGLLKYCIDDRFSYKRKFVEGVLSVDKLGENSYIVTELFSYPHDVTLDEMIYHVSRINSDIETWELIDSDGYRIEFDDEFDVN